MPHPTYAALAQAVEIRDDAVRVRDRVVPFDARSGKPFRERLKDAWVAGWTVLRENATHAQVQHTGGSRMIVPVEHMRREGGEALVRSAPASLAHQSGWCHFFGSRDPRTRAGRMVRLYVHACA